jgi:hypothetical protein
MNVPEGVLVVRYRISGTRRIRGMATFTWQPTSGTTGWETNGAGGWGGTPNYSANDSFEVDGSATLAINAIGAVGSDSADTVTVNDPNATLLMDSTNGPNFNVNTSFVLNAGTFDLGTQGVLFLGNSGQGTITLGANALITDTAEADTDTFISNNGPSSLIQGSGTVVANQGILDIQSGITVARGDTTNFEIAANGVLEFDDAVNGGSVTFLTNSGLLTLTAPQVGDGTNLSDGTFGATIAGLTVGTAMTNGIDIAASTSIVSAALSGTDDDVLTVTDQSSNTYTFDLTGNYTGDAASFAADANAGYDIFLVCYGAGTAILTDQGEVAVESIQPGDSVMTLVDGVRAPRLVKWVGHRDLDLTRHPNPGAVAPIRVLRGALGENLPHRDMVLSPDHCLFIDDALYPVKLLVNDMTIVRDLTARSVSYHHVELERHGVMIAEGAAAESYLDTGNRAFFSNAGLATLLHPELSLNENLRCWNTDACAPLTVHPEAVRPVWQRFADRAVALGHTATVHATTKDSGIHLVVDGKAIRPLAAKDNRVSFMVPADVRSVRLVSRFTCPSALTPWVDDPRDLGVAIRSVTLRDQTGESVMDADHPALRVGWHAPELGPDGMPWRWTEGDAVLPIKASGAYSLEIVLCGSTTYIKESAIEDTARLAA